MQATVDHVVQWVLFKRHSKEELRVNQQGEIAQAVSMGSMVQRRRLAQIADMMRELRARGQADLRGACQSFWRWK